MSDERNTKKAIRAILIVALITILAAAGLFLLLMRVFPRASSAVQSVVENGIELLNYQHMKNGGILKLGSYEQDGQTDNGKEPIEWIILDTDGDQCLIISRFVLDTIPYHTSNSSVTWETSFLRSWLNNTFFSEAFTEAEQAFILTAKLDNSASVDPLWTSSSGGNDTEDRVFLLSYSDAMDLFKSKEERLCKPTAYCMPNTLYVSNVCTWWLRSPGFSQSDAEQVFLTGSIHTSNVHDQTGGVRPAIWISYPDFLNYKKNAK